MPEFDINLYKAKALTLPDDFNLDVCVGKEKVICGFLYPRGNYKHIKNDEEDSWINPYTICRNTGIKINDDDVDYLYEHDLCEIKEGLNIKLGYILWHVYYRCWSVQMNFNYTSYNPIERVQIVRVVGNLTLSDDDAKRFQNKNYSGIRAPIEHRSKQHLNKIAKEFLPK